MSEKNREHFDQDQLDQIDGQSLVEPLKFETTPDPDTVSASLHEFADLDKPTLLKKMRDNKFTKTVSNLLIAFLFTGGMVREKLKTVVVKDEDTSTETTKMDTQSKQGEGVGLEGLIKIVKENDAESAQKIEEAEQGVPAMHLQSAAKSIEIGRSWARDYKTFDIATSQMELIQQVSQLISEQINEYKTELQEAGYKLDTKTVLNLINNIGIKFQTHASVEGNAEKNQKLSEIVLEDVKDFILEAFDKGDFGDTGKIDLTFEALGEKTITPKKEGVDMHNEQETVELIKKDLQDLQSEYETLISLTKDKKTLHLLRKDNEALKRYAKSFKQAEEKNGKAMESNLIKTYNRHKERLPKKLQQILDKYLQRFVLLTVSLDTSELTMAEMEGKPAEKTATTQKSKTKKEESKVSEPSDTDKSDDSTTTISQATQTSKIPLPHTVEGMIYNEKKNKKICIH